MQFDTKRPQTNGTDHSGNSSALVQFIFISTKISDRDIANNEIKMKYGSLSCAINKRII